MREAGSVATAGGSDILHFLFQLKFRGGVCGRIRGVAVLMGGLTLAAQVSSQQLNGNTIQGVVRDTAAKAVPGALVRLEEKGSPATKTVTTNADGAFTFSALVAGTYQLSAEKPGLRGGAPVVVVVAEGDHKHAEMMLEASQSASSDASSAPAPSAQAMQFADQPNFTVAGVTDWTAVGGHGSDSTLRTSEALTRETLALQPESGEPGEGDLPGSTRERNESESRLRAALAEAPGSFEANHQLGEFYFHARRYRDSIPLLRAAYQIDPTQDGNAYDLALAYRGCGDDAEAREQVRKMLSRGDSAKLHRLAAELDEEVGDPLAAVHEFERAARLEPSEQNYFEWGSELLLHRAVWQAQEVFKQGAEAYPKSARMLTALGTALFAGDLYDQAALRICAASDLNPSDLAPYAFLGRIEMAAPAPLACVEPRLARFVRQQPENAQANYLYAMAIWKRHPQPIDPQELRQVESLLTKAVAIDPKCGDAYLQLGILSASRQHVEEAIGFYAKAVEANPQLGEAHYRLGVAYDRVGETAKAKQEFQLHDQIEKEQADAVERQRKEVKQFLVVLQGQPANPASH